MQWPCASLKDADLGARTTLRVGGAVEWLLERDISPFEADKNANTPLLYSAVGCHHECAKHR